MVKSVKKKDNQLAAFPIKHVCKEANSPADALSGIVTYLAYFDILFFVNEQEFIKFSQCRTNNST